MSASVEVRNFVSCFASVLALWIKPDDLANTVEALELNTAPEPTRLRSVLAGSATSALLFRELGLQVAYTEYFGPYQGEAERSRAFGFRCRRD